MKLKIRFINLSHKSCEEQVATLLKVRLFHGCFSRFLNCTNGTKSRKASQLFQALSVDSNSQLKLWSDIFKNKHADPKQKLRFYF